VPERFGVGFSAGPGKTCCRNKRQQVRASGGLEAGSQLKSQGIFTQFFVFCRDAYVKTDVVQVAPEVSGPILKLEVGDNDRVAANAVLFQIDPEPFQIALHTQQAALALAKADLEKAQRQVGLAESQLAAREATLSDAQKTMERIAELFRGGEASALTMDNARKAYQVLQSTYRKRKVPEPSLCRRLSFGARR
jgi:multidrug resistance efflux pump